MEWTKYTIHTTEEAEDLVSGALASLGYTGVEIEDKRPVTPEESGGLFGDVVPEMPEDDHEAWVSFYTEKGADTASVIRGVTAAIDGMRSFCDPGDGSISVSSTAEEDWVNNWKQYFHSFRIDDILIRPTWEDGNAPEDDSAMVLRIDPGTAFGTGAHESTQLAIRALRRYIRPGDRMLDIGTGSGILGIVALKSGASHVFGTDIDDNTLPAIEDNVKQNHISEKDFERVLGDIATEKSVQDAAGYGCYDLVTANIIAEILADITPEVPRHLKKGGVYITSGILTEKEKIVTDAAEKAGLILTDRKQMGEWSSLVFRS